MFGGSWQNGGDYALSSALRVVVRDLCRLMNSCVYARTTIERIYAFVEELEAKGPIRPRPGPCPPINDIVAACIAVIDDYPDDFVLLDLAADRAASTRLRKFFRAFSNFAL